MKYITLFYLKVEVTSGQRFKHLDFSGQGYIPLLEALMCGIDAVEAQGCGCMFTFCHAYLKMGVLLHKMEIVHNQNFMTVDSKHFLHPEFCVF